MLSDHAYLDDLTLQSYCALLEEGKLSEIQKYTNGEIHKIQKGQWRPVQARRDLIRR